MTFSALRSLLLSVTNTLYIWPAVWPHLFLSSVRYLRFGLPCCLGHPLLCMLPWPFAVYTNRYIDVFAIRPCRSNLYKILYAHTHRRPICITKLRVAKARTSYRFTINGMQPHPFAHMPHPLSHNINSTHHLQVNSC